ncbi:cytohesin-2-like, partial [Tropilaelaps mercedesae]
MSNRFQYVDRGGKHSVYRMSASTAEEKDDWMRCIERQIVAAFLAGPKNILKNGNNGYHRKQ